MSDLRKAAKAVIHAWDDPVGMPAMCRALDDLRAALAEQPAPEWWRSGLAATLMREGINKHRAREIADGYWAAYCELEDDCPDSHQPQRQPLSDEEIHDCFQQKSRNKTNERRLITRAIERAHGIGDKYEQ